MREVMYVSSVASFVAVIYACKCIMLKARQTEAAKRATGLQSGERTRVWCNQEGNKEVGEGGNENDTSERAAALLARSNNIRLFPVHSAIV